MPIKTSWLPVFASIFSTLFILLTPVICFGYAPLNTDDAGTTAKGTNQVEQYFFSIIQAGQNNEGQSSTSSGEDFSGIGNAIGFPFNYTRGLTENADLTFTPTYYLAPLGNFSRVGNYTFIYKWRFLGDGEKGTNLALRPSVILPAGTTQQEYGLGNAALNYGFTFIASQFWDSAELHFNAGYLRAPYDNNYLIGQSADPHRANIYSVSIAPVWKISSQLKLAVDVGINTNPNESDSTATMYGLIGLLYSPVKEIDIGLAYQRNANTPGIAVGAPGPYTSRLQVGVSYRFD
jgi:hypothetical protein